MTTLDDNRIIELYFARDERAIEETKASYGRLIYSVAFTILENAPDSEECENDTYLHAWNSIPPTRPNFFSAYLTKIARNLSLNRLRDGKRSLNADLVFEEISDAIPDVQGDVAEEIELRDAMNSFVGQLGKTKRQIFLKRYFYMRSIKDISGEMGLSSVNVKVILSRTRKELREYLEERGLVV